jgi:serine/threonine-protein kinase
LVLYELFTGKKAFEATSLAEWRRKHSEEQPAPPSSHIADVDPAAERAILRCLEKDPRARPASPLQVAAALPGGDPLAAALAAGETPSPEMVAAAGETEGLRPAIALPCLLLVFVGLFLACFLSDKSELTSLVSLDNPPEVLAAKARELTLQLGYAPGADRAVGFIQDDDYLNYVRDHDKSRTRWQALTSDQPAAIKFWYRESPRALAVEKFFAGRGPLLIVTPDDPARTISGMTYVEMDPKGRLLRFEAVPPQVEESKGSAPAPDWSPLFAAASLDLKQFRPTEPKWTPLAWGDSRIAWEGTFPLRPDLPLRVEATGFRGKPVYFHLIAPWMQPERDRPSQTTTEDKVGLVVALVLFWSVVFGGIFLARRNFRLGRGDRRGAYRLAVFTGAVLILLWAFTSKHVAGFHEFLTFLMGAGGALIDGSFVWLAYIALEPYARRRWPQALISWSRMLSGQFRDPLVGRDVLIGVLFAVGRYLLVLARDFVAGWLSAIPAPPIAVALEPLIGARIALGEVLAAVALGLILGFALFFLFFLLRVLLRREWLAALVFVSLFVAEVLPSNYPVVHAIYMAVVYGSLVLLMTRLGLVALSAEQITFYCLWYPPMTLHLGAWYGTPTVFVLDAITAIAVYGFRTSLAGRPIFSGAALEE